METSPDPLEAIIQEIDSPMSVEPQPIEEHTIPAGWGRDRTVRYLRRVTRTPGEYRLRFSGRITPSRARRIVEAFNISVDRCRGAGIGWDDEFDGSPRPTIEAVSDGFGPYLGETMGGF